ncbi:MAG: hypothetical protein IME98_00350 [Proteobacteria bacterium]|nr:hypothetical protein [Pseudomonadota bacterium]
MMDRMRSKLIKAPLIIALLFILTSCGFWMLPLRREKSQDFAIRGGDFSKAFDTCVKAVTDLNFEITMKDKPKGEFRAERGYGFDEITTLHFHLKEGYRKKLDFTVTVKSSRGANTVIESFIDSIEKYMDAIPIRPPTEQK